MESEEVELAASNSDDGHWNCGVCTYRNVPSMQHCSMCQTVKTAPTPRTALEVNTRPPFPRLCSSPAFLILHVLKVEIQERMTIERELQHRMASAREASNAAAVEQPVRVEVNAAMPARGPPDDAPLAEGWAAAMQQGREQRNAVASPTGVSLRLSDQDMEPSEARVDNALGPSAPQANPAGLEPEAVAEPGDRDAGNDSEEVGSEEDDYRDEDFEDEEDSPVAGDVLAREPGPVPREQITTLEAAEIALRQADDVLLQGTDPPHEEEEEAEPDIVEVQAEGVAMGEDAEGHGDVVSVAFSELEACTGGFCEEHLLGQGGQSKVYRGHWSRNLCAIKLVTDHELLGDRGFRQEVAALSQCRHRNVMPILAACFEGPQKAIVMPFMAGGTLTDRLVPGRGPLFSGHSRVRALAGAAQGLAFFHSRGLLHWDVKSDNILLDWRGEPPQLEAVLADAGFTRAEESPAQGARYSTRLGQVGTPGYTDPYYAANNRYYPWSDVFAVGIILLEILSSMQVNLHPRPNPNADTLPHPLQAVLPAPLSCTLREYARLRSIDEASHLKSRIT